MCIGVDFGPCFWRCLEPCFWENLGAYFRVYLGFIWGPFEGLEEPSGISLGWLAREGDWVRSGQGSSCESHWGPNSRVRIPSTIFGRNPYSNIVSLHGPLLQACILYGIRTTQT